MFRKYSPKQSWRHYYYKQPLYKRPAFYFFIIVFIILFFLLLNSWQNNSLEPGLQKKQPPTTVPAAKLIYLEGTAFAKTKAANQWEPVNLNYQLPTNNIFKTGPKTHAILELPDKSLIRLNANTEIKLSKLTLTDVIIEQNYGRAFYRINDNTPLIFRVQHQRIEFTALGTAFDISTIGQTAEIIGIANAVKIKIYDKANENIIKIETLEQGYKAIINPSLIDNQMIKISSFSSNNALADNWLIWNKNLDNKKNFFLGILGQGVELTIIEPQTMETKTTEQNIEIKGKTDPQADIFLNGNQLKNENGNFSFNALLEPGKNFLDIIVKKDKYTTKKTLTIICQPEKSKEKNSLTEKQTVLGPKARIILSAEQEQGSLILNWTTEDISNAQGFITLISNTPSPSYPSAPSHTLSPKNTSDIWKGLSKGTYYARVCLKENNKCSLYSNEISIDFQKNNAPPIILSGKIVDGIAYLNWQVKNYTPSKGYKLLMAKNKTPIWPNAKHHLILGASQTGGDQWTNLEKGINYHFRVCESTSNGCGIYSNEIILTYK